MQVTGNMAGMLLRQYPQTRLQRVAMQSNALSSPMLAEIAISEYEKRKKRGGLFNEPANQKKNAMARQFGMSKEKLFGDG